VGDYFAEFMAGGIAVICGINPQNPANVLGYRPLVGMVGGKVFFRGPHGGFSQADAQLVPIQDEDSQWLCRGLKRFLDDIGRAELYDDLSDLTQWQLLSARQSHEKAGRARQSMAAFHRQVWEKGLGPGGLIGDLTSLDRSPIPVITTGRLRRMVPVWENRKYKAPCEATCPSGIPLQERWRLIRQGRVDEAVDLALAYTPFPASVCGYLCPNLCMQACTRQTRGMLPVDTTRLGRASIAAGLPVLPPESGRRVAVIGAGPAGISVAWQLRRLGHRAVVYDRSRRLGGKMQQVIPASRIPADVLAKELERAGQVIPQVHLQQDFKPADVEQLKADYDAVVIATGAQNPRLLPIPGIETAKAALDFLMEAKAGTARVGPAVVIVGAGNVGCDAATEAHRLGAQSITLIDIQEPASFGKERQAAEAAGAVFRWPVAAQAIEARGVRLADGELIAADTVIVSIGDAPDLSFLPPSIETQRGFVKVNALFQTSEPKIFAIGDVVRPGLLTDAIGAGRQAAQAIGALLAGSQPVIDDRPMIDPQRVKTAYLDPRVTGFESLGHCGSQCSSCGACRDCGICAAICPQGAIARIPKPGNDYAYEVDPDRCIGCGFCAGACPCGVWDLVANEPID
jgi:NADPH-dependent glutamate synthase beta subunit-like oxidoreductase/NAD-dependent dihydropyrimidine dehydrogenase PreA subunit